MDATNHVFRHMDAHEIADLERVTGLLVDEEASWSAADYDRVIAYLRRMAGRRTPFVWDRGCAARSMSAPVPATIRLPLDS